MTNSEMAVRISSSAPSSFPAPLHAIEAPAAYNNVAVVKSRESMDSFSKDEGNVVAEMDGEAVEYGAKE